jgi:FMN-dependent NADH-azoreductase
LIQETDLRAILGLIGVEDIDSVRAEGVALGPEQREASPCFAEWSSSVLT